ncbi:MULTISPECIES: transketolase family protein [Citrobacter]|uniref:Transketolase n=1 Tax=Citrobacter telavivensis TaxID=2653932 RepID=A0A6L5E488_9ENTR|nr:MULTISPECIES: transketolase C-terminal domain-containing protein [Citrobacter]MDM2737228.1 transketolase [Citrobacter sp. Ct235]MPQ49398.1 transketolase [Citrobacter telavivensis]QFS72504.1 transketolase [Citrobacter telavivensis]CAI9397468.1 Apulose-4-phosphate transketolase subunit B [Citrobacter sp. T1.2D-1]
MRAPRDEIGNALLALKDKGYPVVVIDSDLASSTRTDQFQKSWPDAFFEMGIAEGSAMSFATGQALEGNIPFYVNFAMFVTGTAWTQLRQACYAKANIKLVGSHPGMDDGPDGASHHALEDLALTRVLPGITILTPADAEEVEAAFEQAANIHGPVYIRVAREPMPVRDKSAVPRVTDIDAVEDSGNDFAILYEGTVLEQASAGYEQLHSTGKRGKLIHVATLKPFNRQRFLQLIAGCPQIVTIENHTITGGLGGQVAEVLAEEGLGTKLIRLGTQDTFTESGNSRQLKEKYGISASAVYNALSKG